MTGMGTITVIVALWAVLRLAEHLHYRDARVVYEAILKGDRINPASDRDLPFQAMTMLAIWCELAAALWCCGAWPSAPVLLVGALVIGGRFRALQEVGHTALHLGFGSSKSAQWTVADLLGNYLIWKPDSGRRFQSHCVAHHPQAASEADPNVVRLRQIGLTPGISRARFWVLFFHPLTPAGLIENFTFIYRSVGPPKQALARAALNAAVVPALR